MQNQEIFDKVAAHLLAQNAKAQCDLGSGNLGCVYLDPTTGHKCAVGCLIPADNYHPNMEGRSPYDLQRNYDLFTDVDEELLNDLQRTHDEYDPDEWKDQLHIIAKDYDLHAKF